MVPVTYASQLQSAGDLAHIGFVVKDMDRAMRHWLQTGTMIIPPTHDPIQKVVCALLLIKDAVAIELVAPVSSDDPGPLQSRLKRGGGLDHMCFFVDDVSAAFDVELAAKAIALVPPVYGCVFDREIAFVQTRAGLTIELMSRKSVGLSAHDPLEGVINPIP